ncbi:MAG: tetratricopeptide repeat protein [Planktothrix sp.]|uniref:tetratricopeptide repeat protein n=1 Tax=Planktothrix sp. TaxID=3088171 RepID=UPI0038D3CEBC
MQQSEKSENSVVILYQQASDYIAQQQYEEAITTCQKILQLQPNFALAYSTIGLAKQLQGHLEEAKSYYENALKLQPNWVEVKANLGTIYLQQKQWEKALKYYQIALQLKPNQVGIYRNLYSVWMNLNQREKALDCWCKVLILDPQCVSAQDYINFGKTLIEKGKFDQALELYTKSVEIYPDLPQSYYWLGEICFKTRKLQEAIDWYRQGIEINPNGFWLYFALGNAWFETQQFDEALAAYQQAIELEPNVDWLYPALGKVLTVQQQWNQAINAYCKAVELNPNHFWLLDQLTEILIEQQEVKTAIPVYQNCLKVNPKAYVLHYHLANLYKSQGQWDDAIIHYQKVIQLSPNFSGAYPQLANALSAQKRWEEAIDFYRQAIEINPDSFWLHCALGNALFETQQLDDALVAYQQAIELEPNVDWLYPQLGKVLTIKRQWYQVIQAYYKAVELNPNNLLLLEQLAETLIEQQEVETAIFLYQERVKVAPQAHVLHYNLGNLYKSQSQWDEAIAFYEKAININANVAEYYAALGEAWLNKQELDQAMFHLMESLKMKSDLFPVYDSIAEILQQQGKTKEAVDCYNHKKLPRSIVEQYCFFNPDQLITSESSSNVTYIPVYPSSKISLKPSRTISQDHPGMIFGGASTRNAFVVTLDNGRVWGNAATTAIITAQNELLTDISTGCGELVLSSNKLPPVYKIDGTVAFLSIQWGEGFYHWMYELFPGIHLIQQSGIYLDSIDYFVFNSYHYAFQKETLQKLGIPESKIIESCHQPHIQAKKVIVPSPNFYHIASAWICQFLKQQLVDQDVYKIPANRRIYISRGQANHRYLLNEDKLLQSLKPFNFETVVLESLTISEQAELMASASVVLAPHGAGLSNLVFCQPGTKVIELFAPDYVIHCYRIICNICDLEHYYLIGEIIEDKIVNAPMDLIRLNIQINIDDLICLLELAGVT